MMQWKRVSSWFVVLLCAVFLSGCKVCDLFNSCGGSSSKAAASLSWSDPSSWPSGVAFGSTENVTITLTNSGEQSATNMALSVPSGYWSDTGSGTCGASLGTGSSCTYVFEFRSPGEGSAATADVSLSYSDGNQTKTLSKTLTGSGAKVSLTVSAAYPTNGANWNQYVPRGDTSKDLFSQSDSDCTGSETGNPLACFHAGEIRTATLSGASSCGSRSASDSLGVLKWHCVEQGGAVKFYSYGFQEGKGLKDLIDASGWKSIYLTVTNGSYVEGESSASTSWWGNAVAAVPDSTSAQADINVLADEGKIFYIGSDTTGNGFNITIDEVALVTLPGVTYTSKGAGAASCNGVADTCLVESYLNKHVWIEGHFDGASAVDEVVRLRGATFSRVHGVDVERALNHGISLFSNADYNHVTDIRAYNNGDGAGDSGVRLHYADYSFVHNIKAVNNSSYGLYLYASHRSVVHDLVGTNNQTGLKFYGSNNVVVTQALVANNSGSGVSLDGTTGNYADYLTLSHLTATNMLGGVSGGGMSGSNATGVTVSQALLANSDSYGLRFYDMDNLTGAQIASIGNDSSPIFMNLCDSGTFKHRILVGSSETCSVSNGTNPGLTSACAGSGSPAASDATVVSGVDVSASFVGKISSDSNNTTDTSGLTAYTDLTDGVDDYLLTLFDSAFRAFGVDGSAFPNTDHWGRCSSGNCRIWDWRLSSSDTQVLNRSGDGTNANAAFTAGSACPSAVDGDFTVSGANDTYLANAIEIVGDGRGDENGLCESNEHCIYSPNFGAYQGEGDYLNNGTCTFSDGASVTGVTMYAYPTNGG